MKRKGNKVRTDDYVITVPNDHSGISIVCDNRVDDGDDFRTDGYVYNKNKRIRKWLSNLQQFKIWHPVYENIETLEQRRYKVACRCNIKMNTSWANINKKFKGDVSGIYNNNTFVIVKHDDYLSSYSFENYIYTHKRMAKKNQKLVDEYFAAEINFDKWSRWKAVFNVSFIHAINKKYENEIRKMNKEGRFVCKMDINGRTYWFNQRDNYLSELAYPENIINFSL